MGFKFALWDNCVCLWGFPMMALYCYGQWILLMGRATGRRFGIDVANPLGLLQGVFGLLWAAVNKK